MQYPLFWAGSDLLGKTSDRLSGGNSSDSTSWRYGKATVFSSLSQNGCYQANSSEKVFHSVLILLPAFTESSTWHGSFGGTQLAAIVKGCVKNRQAITFINQNTKVADRNSLIPAEFNTWIRQGKMYLIIPTTENQWNENIIDVKCCFNK